MDKDLLTHEIVSDSGVEVGLSWKTIYLGVKGPIEYKVKVKALHVEINTICHQQKFTTLSNKFVISNTDSPWGIKMRLFHLKNKTKSDHSNKKLMKAVLRQKSFLEVIQSDTNTDILTLDMNI